MDIVKDSVKAFNGLSHIATHELKVAWRAKGISTGLEKVGMTRFGTFPRACRALEKCYLAIQHIAEQGNMDMG